MSCNIDTYIKKLQQGIDGAIVLIARKHTRDPLGYTVEIAGQTLAVTAVQEDADVRITVPLVALGLEIGTHKGYFVTNTKTEGNFFQFKIQLEITKNLENDGA